ncbi:type III-A CRISPR-associated protein Csm2 [Acidaminococcus massiliensis]|uniref:type III-A CRISPR-associated protein Csm2 n=1 Tax=Acidaminococcus massiliensis TaxID=1852375 RepID=UPI0026DCD46B|nr:type III-A CRISPR-associated protein Csm2 [Acidaminococcus massiliensis]
MIDIVKEAEDVIRELRVKTIDKRTGKEVEVYVLEMKTTQIRKFLTAVNKLSNEIAVYKAQHVGERTLPEDICAQIRFLKVKVAYQIGWEKGEKNHPIEKFMKKAKILDKINAIGNSIHAFEQFANYMEALVAYHKYYGGKD